MALDPRLRSARLALRVGFGLMAFLAGLDKFFNLLTTWAMYLSPLFERFLPVPTSVFMKTTGVVEMLVGVAILTSATRLGAYVAMGWLLAIAANLLSTGMFFDLAVRDTVLAVGAFTLARLSEVHDTPNPVEVRP